MHTLYTSDQFLHIPKDIMIRWKLIHGDVITEHNDNRAIRILINKMNKLFNGQEISFHLNQLFEYPLLYEMKFFLDETGTKYESVYYEGIMEVIKLT